MKKTDLIRQRVPKAYYDIQHPQGITPSQLKEAEAILYNSHTATQPKPHLLNIIVTILQHPTHDNLLQGISYRKANKQYIVQTTHEGIKRVITTTSLEIADRIRYMYLAYSDQEQQILRRHNALTPKAFKAEAQLDLNNLEHLRIKVSTAWIRPSQSNPYHQHLFKARV